MLISRIINLYFNQELIGSFIINDEIHRLFSQLENHESEDKVVFTSVDILCIYGLCENLAAKLFKDNLSFKSITSLNDDNYTTYKYALGLIDGLKTLLPLLDYDSEIVGKYEIKIGEI